MNRKQILAVYVFAALFTSMTVSVAYSQRADPQVLTQNEIQDKERAMYLKIIENGDPVADFYEAQADNPQERSIRQSKNAKGDVKSKPAPLDWQRGELGITMRTDQFVEPAFPAEANLVAFGVVNRAEAHVSPDRTDIFSQFDFQIEKILKDATSENHQQGNSIILIRGGDKVLLPDGRIYYRALDGTYMPKQGKEYVMFLRSDGASPSYEIVAAYAVNNGKVESLDGISLLDDGEPLSRYRHRLQYNGADINEFLEIVRREVGATK